LYAALVAYKESSLAETRHRYMPFIVDAFGAFATRHRPCIEALMGGSVDVVLAVPSSRRRGVAPLDSVPGLQERLVSALSVTGRATVSWRSDLLCRTSVPIGHMRPDLAAFVADPSSVDGARVVLLDDTYVSGSRAQSVAAALRSAGARAMLIVPLGRTIRPDRLARHAALLRKSRTRRDQHCARCALDQCVAETPTG
jgi:hypothetical protein